MSEVRWTTSSRVRSARSPVRRRGIADHAGRAAGKRDGVMARQLESPKHEEGQEVADMRDVGGGVEPGVERDRAGSETLRETLAIGDIGDEAAPGEIGEDVLGTCGGLIEKRALFPRHPERTSGNGRLRHAAHELTDGSIFCDWRSCWSSDLCLVMSCRRSFRRRCEVRSATARRRRHARAPRRARGPVQRARPPRNRRPIARRHRWPLRIPCSTPQGFARRARTARCFDTQHSPAVGAFAIENHP